MSKKKPKPPILPFNNPPVTERRISVRRLKAHDYDEMSLDAAEDIVGRVCDEPHTRLYINPDCVNRINSDQMWRGRPTLRTRQKVEIEEIGTEL